MPKRKYIEDDLQITIVSFTRQYVRGIEIICIPNGGYRKKLEAVRLKRMGVLAGVSDLVLMLPEGKTCWVELKTKTGRQEATQIAFQQKCKKLGHKYVLIRSLDEYIALLKTL